jgi:hypothetical protein
MKLKYKFVCKDTEIPRCEIVTYGKRKKDIVRRVQEYLVKNLSFSEAEATNLEIVKKIKSVIRKSQYV